MSVLEGIISHPPELEMFLGPIFRQQAPIKLGTEVGLLSPQLGRGAKAQFSPGLIHEAVHRISIFRNQQIRPQHLFTIEKILLVNIANK